jgi:3-hydroxyisobutyrate dehydrogenase
MLAGEDDAVADVEPLLAPLRSASFRCGPVPGALGMKLAVNLYLVTMVAGLAEAWTFAERQGLDPEVLRAVLDAGPMASNVSRARTRLLAEQAYDDVQTALANVRYNAELIAAAGEGAGAVTPLLADALALYREAEELGAGAEDMAAVARALRERTHVRIAAHPRADGAPL